MNERRKPLKPLTDESLNERMKLLQQRKNNDSTYRCQVCYEPVASVDFLGGAVALDYCDNSTGLCPRYGLYVHWAATYKGTKAEVEATYGRLAPEPTEEIHG